MGRKTVPDIYAEQLMKLDLGWALWNADPYGNYDKIQIGDVGYFADGRFLPEWNCFLQREPAQEIPCPVYTRIDAPDALTSETVSSVNVTVTSDISDPTSQIGGGVEFSCTCNSESGAHLIVEDGHMDAFDLRLADKLDLTEWIVTNRHLLEKKTRLDLNNLIVVTGTTFTRDWHATVWKSNQREMALGANMKAVTISSLGVTFRFHQYQGQILRHSSGHRHRDQPVSENCCPQPINQCVFIRAIRLIRRPFKIRLTAIDLKAAAEPRDFTAKDSDSDDDYETNACLSSTDRSDNSVEVEELTGGERSTPEPSRWEELWQAIFEAAPRAEFATIDDSDVYFWSACSASEKEELALVFDASAKVASLTKESNLIKAASIGHMPMVKHLLRRGANVHALNDKALLRASRNGHVEIAELLLIHGADATDERMLLAASRGGHSEVAQLLLQNGANANSPSAIMNGALGGHVAIVKLLLEYGGDTNGLSLVDVVSEGHAEMTQFLLGLNPSAANLHSLRVAIQNEDIEMVKLLLETLSENGAVISESDLLQIAIHGSHPLVIRLLLDHGADASDKDCFRNVVKWRSLETIELFLKHRADASDSVAFEIAVDRGELEIIKLLLDRGAIASDPEVFRKAIRDINLWMLELLIDHGVDASDPAHFRYAAEFGSLATVRLLLDHGADALDPVAFRNAAKNQSHGFHILEQLIDCGADASDMAAFIIASQYGNTEIVQLLLRHRAGVDDSEAFENDHKSTQTAIKKLSTMVRQLAR